MSEIIEATVEKVEPTEEELNKTTFEVLFNLRNNIANKMVQVNITKEWSLDFKLSTIESAYREYQDYVERMAFKPDVRSLTNDQMQALGFGLWNEEKGLMLIPLWAIPFIEDIEVESITGGKKMLSKVDNDTRFGCIAYGIVPKDFTVDENKGHPVPESLQS